MKKLLLSVTLVAFVMQMTYAQDHCDRRTFVANVSLDMAGFYVLTYGDDLLDSLYWDFGDGTTERQTSNIGTGAANHTYANPGTYNVTLERWGVSGFPSNTTPLHCTYTYPVTIYPAFTDSICGADFLLNIDGDTVTFSNQSIIQSPSFNTHPQHELWDFGNGQIGMFLNRIYPVIYSPGTYTACLYYMGFSFNNGGYFYNCESCTTFTIGNTKINELSSPLQLSFFPNPTYDFTLLTTNEEVSSIEIYDIVGKFVSNSFSKRSANEYELDCRELKKGIYLVKIKTQKGKGVLKMIRN